MCLCSCYLLSCGLTLACKIPGKRLVQERQKVAQEFTDGAGCWWSPASLKNIQHRHRRRASGDWCGRLLYCTLGWKPRGYFRKAWQGCSQVAAASETLDTFSLPSNTAGKRPDKLGPCHQVQLRNCSQSTPETDPKADNEGTAGHPTANGLCWHPARTQLYWFCL